MNLSTQQHHGFSDNPFMLGYDSHIFEEDDERGFRFPNNQVDRKSVV